MGQYRQRGRRAGGVLALMLVALLGTAGNSDAADPAKATAGKPADMRPRLVVDATYYPFSAVGRLQAAGQIFCSATLISARVILTAGHCLWDAKRKTWRPANDIHFVAGYQRSSFIAHGQGVRYLSPLTKENKAPDGASVPNDWALVELDRSIGNDVGWLGLGLDLAATLKKAQTETPAAAPPLFLVAYREDRAHALSLQSPCRITREMHQGAMLLNDCQVVHGSSGSPLIAYQNGQFLVVGVTSARVSYQDRASETATVGIAPLAEAVASYKLIPNQSQVRPATLQKGLQTLVAALSDGTPPVASPESLERLLRAGLTHDKVALPPMSFPELQKCRGDCAQADKP